MVVRPTLFDDLSNELFGDIFQYLRIQNQFEAFYNLNQRLNQFLLTRRCWLTVRGNDDQTRYFLENVLPQLSSTEHITRLRLEQIRRLNAVPNHTLLQFPGLRFLTLSQVYVDDTMLDFLHAHTTNLEYLDMSDRVSHKWNLILEYLLSLPNLIRCRLLLGILLCPPKLSNKQHRSRLEQLTLLGPNQSCRTEHLVTNLTHFSHLKTVHLKCPRLIIPPKDYPNSLPSIVNFTMELTQMPIVFIHLSDFLQKTMPQLEHLTIRCTEPLRDITFLIPSRWQDLFDHVPHLKTVSLSFSRMKTIDEAVWNSRRDRLKQLASERTIQLHFYSNTV